MNHKAVKLQIELVPKTSWGNNLRRAIPSKEWDEIRKTCYAQYNHQCAVCGFQGRLSCHEIWDYDDLGHIQKLIGFIALCDMCHHVKHMGRAGIRAAEGKLDFNRLIEHYMAVNHCSRDDFKQHKAEAFSEWRERSRHEWKVDLGTYQDFVKK